MKYLVAIDGSQCSKNAFEKLLNIVKPGNDSVDFVCIGADVDMNEEYKGIAMAKSVVKLLIRGINR